MLVATGSNRSTDYVPVPPAVVAASKTLSAVFLRVCRSGCMISESSNDLDVAPPKSRSRKRD